MEEKSVLIVGGVDGGASCAARARRLSESAEIIMFDRGEYVSFANCGMIAANVLRGDALGKSPAFILDVRNPSEYQQDHIEDAVNIPLDELRNRMGEVPKDQEIWTYCAVGQRSYYASRALSQYGYDINNLSGGFKTFTLKEALEFI